MNRRVIGLLGAAVLAVIGTIVLVSFVRNAEDRALEGEEVVDVLVLTGDVPAGTPAEELADVVELEKVQRKVIPSGAVADLEQITGLVASVNLVEDEIITTLRFVTPERFAPARGSIEVPEGLVEASVSLGPTESVGGVIRPGDRVAIVGSFDGITPEGESTSGLLFQQVLVTNVQGATVPTVEEGAVSDRPAAPGGGLLITLALEPNQVERLVFATQYGNIFMALQTEDDPIVDVNIQTGEIIYTP